jgi:ribosomal protein L7/L12
MSDEIKTIIDGDSQTVLGHFHEDNAEEIKEQFEEMGLWEDVSFDIDGDLVLYETL